jgi:hypothetical protein
MERGKGSRVAIRKKLFELIDEGLVEKSKALDYRLVE